MAKTQREFEEDSAKNTVIFLKDVTKVYCDCLKADLGKVSLVLTNGKTWSFKCASDYPDWVNKLRKESGRKTYLDPDEFHVNLFESTQLNYSGESIVRVEDGHIQLLSAKERTLVLHFSASTIRALKSHDNWDAVVLELGRHFPTGAGFLIFNSLSFRELYTKLLEATRWHPSPATTGMTTSARKRRTYLSFIGEVDDPSLVTPLCVSCPTFPRRLMSDNRSTYMDMTSRKHSAPCGRESDSSSSHSQNGISDNTANSPLLQHAASCFEFDTSSPRSQYGPPSDTGRLDTSYEHLSTSMQQQTDYNTLSKDWP